MRFALTRIAKVENKIEAIKAFRASTGLGLKDSKIFVETVMSSSLEQRVFLPDNIFEVDRAAASIERLLNTGLRLEMVADKSIIGQLSGAAQQALIKKEFRLAQAIVSVINDFHFGAFE